MVGGVDARQAMLDNDVQQAKQSFSIFLIVLGNVMLERLLQFKKHHSSTDVTDDGMEMLVSLSQFLKHSLLNFLTP